MARPSPLLLSLALATSLAAALGIPAAANPPDRSRASVVSVGDGDTIRVRQDGRLITVRLACIDAPELSQRPWGERSRAYLQQRLPPGTAVTLLVKDTDRYGRTVAEVISEISINLVMVEDGQAFAYRRYLHNCDAREFLDAERRASRHRYGIWQPPGGIERPWDARHQHRSASTSTSANTAAGRLRCRQIGSWAGAQELLRQGHSELDGDGDGEACESLR